MTARGNYIKLPRDVIEDLSDCFPAPVDWTLLRLVAEADHRTGVVGCSVRELERRWGTRRETLRAHLKQLEEAGEIEVTPGASIRIVRYAALTGGAETEPVRGPETEPSGPTEESRTPAYDTVLRARGAVGGSVGGAVGGSVGGPESEPENGLSPGTIPTRIKKQENKTQDKYNRRVHELCSRDPGSQGVDEPETVRVRVIGPEPEVTQVHIHRIIDCGNFVEPKPIAVTVVEHQPRIEDERLLSKLGYSEEQIRSLVREIAFDLWDWDQAWRVASVFAEAVQLELDVLTPAAVVRALERFSDREAKGSVALSLKMARSFLLEAAGWYGIQLDDE